MADETDQTTKQPTERTPRYHLDEYRKFIREAAPYVSIIAGRRIRATEADQISDEDLIRLALLIDERADSLKKP